MNQLTESEKQRIIHLTESIEPNQFKGLSTKIKYLYPVIFQKIKEMQNSLNVQTISECLYLIINDMDSIPICSHLSDKCHGKLKFKNILEGYHDYCKVCSSLNDDFKLKRTETNMERYGCEYPTQNQLIKNKTVQTNLKKYGVKNVRMVKNECRNRYKFCF